MIQNSVYGLGPDMDVGPFLVIQPNPVANRPNPTHETSLQNNPTH